MLMSAFAKDDFCCMIFNFLETVHLISGDVNELRLAIVQTTDNERTHQLSSVFPRHEMRIERALIPLISRYAERLMW